MMYPFMTLNDDTEITHSEMKPDGTVKVYIETPRDDGRFNDATCWLPMYRWEVHGYSYLETLFLRHFVTKHEDMFMKYAQEGGIIDADNP